MSYSICLTIILLSLDTSIVNNPKHSNEILFWTSEFWAAQSKNTSVNIGEINKVNWSIVDTKLMSGHIGFFGGLNPQLESHSPRINQISHLLEQAESFAEDNNLNSIEIRMPPLGYYPKFDEIIYPEMKSHSWRVIGEEIFSFMNTNVNYQSGLHRNRSYDLNWWEKRHTQYSVGLDIIEIAYKVITDNYRVRKRVLNISLEKLLELSRLTGNRIEGHLITHNGQNISAAITLKIDDELLHIFKWANSPRTEEDGPSSLALLYKHIFERSQNLGFGKICLGSSSIGNGIIDQGLLTFKTTLGFSSCKRFIMKRHLA